MKTEKRNIISFYELSEAWQDEARSNLDEYAEEAMYLEPEHGYDPNIVLWDLSEAMRTEGTDVYTGFKHNPVITISNNSAMLLNVSDDGEEAEYIIV